jgi:GntR family transcriptional regulator
MAIETLHVREALVPGLEKPDLEGRSFYELLRERYGIVIAGGAQTIEPTVTNDEESAALGVPLHSPAFLFERVTHANGNEIIEFVHSIYRGDRYRLVTDLTALPSPRRPALAGPRPAPLDGSGLDQT